MDEKRLYSIRGAVCCQNTKDSVLGGTEKLCKEIFTLNHIEASDIVNIQFTLTPDIDAMNPATALRLSKTGIDTSLVPLFCSQEPVVQNMLDHVIRVMVTVYLPKGTSVKTAYLNGAQALRPDLP